MLVAPSAPGDPGERAWLGDLRPSEALEAADWLVPPSPRAGPAGVLISSVVDAGCVPRPTRVTWTGADWVLTGFDAPGARYFFARVDPALALELAPVSLARRIGLPSFGDGNALTGDDSWPSPCTLTLYDGRGIVLRRFDPLPSYVVSSLARFPTERAWLLTTSIGL